MQPLPRLPTLHLSVKGGGRSTDHPALNFKEFIRLNPPSVGANHYKGNMVYANFGYFLIGGKWVDLESRLANKSVSQSSASPLVPADWLISNLLTDWLN